MTFHADNRTLVTASADKTARLSDVAVLAVFEAHKGGVAGIAFRNTGTQVLTGGADRTVKVWDAAQLSTGSGKVVLTLGPLADPVSAVTYSRDANAIAAAAGKVVTVWNAAAGKLLGSSLTHPAAVTSVSFNSDRSRVVTGAADNLARVWDVASGKELESFAHTGPVSGVAFHPANTTIVSGGGDKTATVHTLRFLRLVAASDGPVRGLALTPNGASILTANSDKSVKMWNLNTGAVERTFAGAEAAVGGVAVSRNNALVAAGGADKTVRVYNFADARLIATLKAPGAVKGVSFSPNNLSLVATCDGGAVQTWSVVAVPGQPLPELKPGLTYTHEGVSGDIAFAPDSISFFTGGADKTVKTWKLASDNPVRNLGHPQMVDAVAFNPAGTVLATGCHDGNLRLYDVAKGTVIRQVAAHTTPPPAQAIYTIAWSPDGKFVVTGSLDHSLKMWDGNTGALVRTFRAYKQKEFEKGHMGGVYCVAFSPDGKTLASGSNDRTIKLWNVADGSVVRELANAGLKTAPGSPPLSHPGEVYNVRFTADGKQLVSVGLAPRNHGYLALWNVADGKLLSGEALPLGPFFSAALSPDGKFIAVGAGSRGSFAAAGGKDGNPTYILKMPKTASQSQSQ
jgi:WD40 repeat protein